MVFINKRLNINKSELCLYIGTILMVLKALFTSSKIIEISTTADNIMIWTSIFFFGVSILFENIEVKRFFWYLIIALFCIYVSRKANNFMLVITCITCFALIGKDFNKFVRVMFFTTLAVFLLHCIHSLVTYIFDPESKIIHSEGQGFNFSFGHSNSAAIIYANLVYMWLWNNFERAKGINLFVILLISCLVWSLTKSDTVLIEIILGVLLYYTIRFARKDLSNFLKNIICIIMPILLIFFLIISLNYLKNIEAINWLDDALTGRVKYGAYAYERWGITPFGNGVDAARVLVTWDPIWLLNNFTFDCIYTYFLFNFGWIWGIVLFMLFAKLANRGDVKINYFIVLWILYGITEVHGLNGYMFFPIFLLSKLFTEDVSFKRRVKGKNVRA